MKMDEKKQIFELQDVFCMPEDIAKNRYSLEDEEDPTVIFEGDPDYFIDEQGNVTYFDVDSENGIVWYYWEPDERILEWVNSTHLYPDNTRGTASSCFCNSDHWDNEDLDTWDDFEKCKNPKIAWRGGCGYVYRLFEYKN